jgi:uroporphyrinogen III methyltransferase/synthase
MNSAGQGKVFLVGAGPGDPGLITVKGLELLGQADVIIYDYLANPSLLQAAKAGAELIFVGKKVNHHTMSQAQINTLLIEHAQAGKSVVRLKGGDPFVFGRGGEEAQVLHAAGINFEIVPGVTSAIAVPAYAGIPVTHRGVVSSFTVLTGHENPNEANSTSRLDWEALARTGGTLVFLMGVSYLENIAAQLIAAGKSPLTPAACISWGTMPEQQTVTGTLENIYQVAQAAGIKPPAVTVIGEVVGLREELRWFAHDLTTPSQDALKKIIPEPDIAH